MYRPSLWFCQVAPAELEEILRSHPDIDDAAVFGVPDDTAGEGSRAFVVPGRPDISEEDVKSFIAAKVPDHKQLKWGVQFLTAITKSPSGKILRRQLNGVLYKSPLWLAQKELKDKMLSPVSSSTAQLKSVHSLPLSKTERL